MFKKIKKYFNPETKIAFKAPYSIEDPTRLREARLIYSVKGKPIRTEVIFRAVLTPAADREVSDDDYLDTSWRYLETGKYTSRVIDSLFRAWKHKWIAAHEG